MPVSSRPFGEAWSADHFATVDRLDPEELAGWYADDASFRFANQPPAQGKAAIAAALRQFYGLITSMRHEKTGCWADADSGAWEAIAHFETKDGRRGAGAAAGGRGRCGGPRGGVSGLGSRVGHHPVGVGSAPRRGLIIDYDHGTGGGPRPRD